jgi:hypothetical protein
MPAVTEEMPIQRFQFALRDLLLIVVACAVWTAIIPPFWVPKSFDIQFSSTFWYPPWACVTTLVVVLLSGASSLILTASSRIDATTRSGWLALFLVLVPLLFCIVIALLMHRMHVHTAAEKAHLRLGGLASGQERYRLDHGEYSPSLGNLDPYVPSMERPFSSAEGLPGQPGVRPIDSYVFRILKAQGSHAPGGRKSYIKTDKDGKKWLTEGFAIIAIPASGEKGIILMVACCGDLICLFGKALGPDAAQIASQITEFDPDESWIEVKR